MGLFDPVMRWHEVDAVGIDVVNDFVEIDFMSVFGLDREDEFLSDDLVISADELVFDLNLGNAVEVLALYGISAVHLLVEHFIGLFGQLLHNRLSLLGPISSEEVLRVVLDDHQIPSIILLVCFQTESEEPYCGLRLWNGMNCKWNFLTSWFRDKRYFSCRDSC